MNRNPLYTFTDLNSKGIDTLPLNTIMQIIDIDGDPLNGITVPKMVQLTSKAGVNELTTIAQFLLLTNNYIDLAQLEEIPSELEKITEGTVVGWRLLGRDTNNYGPIGRGSVDFSIAPIVGLITKPYGAQAENSFASGYGALCTGYASTAFGIETKASNRGSFSIGQYNIGSFTQGASVYNIFEIGVGLTTNSRKNAFEVDTDGIVRAPEMTISDINTAGITALVTKEYSDANLNSKVSTSGDTITGLLTIEVDGTNITLDNQGLSNFERTATFGSDITIGLDSGSPILSRINFSDIIPASSPALYWNTSLKNFFIDTDLVQGVKLWHGGNHGASSGLDADTIHGISGADISTTGDINSALDLKFDKIGGTITGDTLVQGLSTLTGIENTSTMNTSGVSYFGGLVTVGDNINVTGNVDILGALDVPLIVSNTRFIGTIDFDSTVNTNGLVNITSGILIKHTGGRDSVIQFQDANAPAIHRSIFWSTDDNKFIVNPDGTNEYEMWHAGNLPQSSFVQTFDDLSDTPNFKEAGKFLKVTTDGQGIEYGLIDNSSASWGSINGILGDQLDLQAELNLKFDKIGGSITGGLAVSGLSTFAGDLTSQTNFISNGTCTINGTMSMNTVITPVTFMDAISAVSISASQDITAGRNLIAGTDANGYSGILCEPSGGNTPYIYWDTNTNLFKINDSYGFGQEVYHSGNFASSGKYDITGGDILGDVSIKENPSDPATFGYGDLDVERNVSIGGTIQTQGSGTFGGIAVGSIQNIPVGGGIVTIEPAGNIVFTPDIGYTGSALFSYTISDGFATSTASISGTVVATGTQVLLAGDIVLLDIEDGETTEILNDLIPLSSVDPTQGGLTVTNIDGVAVTGGVQSIPVTGGSIDIDIVDQITFTGTPGFTGGVSFGVTIQDSLLATDILTLSGTIIATGTSVLKAVNIRLLDQEQDTISGSLNISMIINDTVPDSAVTTITEINGVVINNFAKFISRVEIDSGLRANEILVTGNSILTDLELTGTANFEGLVSIAGNVSMASDLNITGLSSFQNNAVFNNTVIITGSTTVANITAENMVVNSGISGATNIVFTDLPISDPGVSGQLWDNAGALMISQ